RRARPCRTLIPRDDLALAAMDGALHARIAGLASQDDRRPPRLDRAAPSSPPDRGGDTQRADARERLAQYPVGLGHEERHAEHARPRMPLGDDLGALGRAIER